MAGVYGSLEKALKLGLNITEYYAKPDPNIARGVRGRVLNYVPVIWVPETSNPSEGVVDIYGEQRLFAFSNSGCISNPNIRKRVIGKVREVATRLEAKALVLDALRFPSPHDGGTLYSCFCSHCRSVMKELGVNPEELKSRLRSLVKVLHRYPYLSQDLTEALHTWVRVRQHVVCEVLSMIRDEARQYGLRLWAALFPPSLAWLAGQNYEPIKQSLDEAHVMLYHKCGEAACLNHELQSLAELITKNQDKEQARTTLRILTGLSIENPFKLEAKGLDTGIILEEVARAKALLGGKAVPILQLDSQGLRTAKNLQGFTKITYLA